MANKMDKRGVDIYINNKTPGTLDHVKEEARLARKEMKGLVMNTEEYNAAIRRLQTANTTLHKHSQQVAGVNKSWQNIKDNVKSFGITMLAYLGGSAILSGFQNLIGKFTELADLISNVKRTTGFTTEMVEEMQKEFSSFNTRTARSELLKYAEEAGKQGMKSVAEVTKFVREMDQAVIALGGDLGQSTIEDLGKLTVIYRESALNIGNAMLEIANSSIASAPYQVDFMKRMGGIALTTDLLTESVLGYGATLENLGITQEVAGTAMSQVFMKLTKDTENFGKVAGFANGELSKIIGEEGTNAGFIAFLEKLKDSSAGATDLIQKLDELKLDGTKVAGVLLSLANNTDILADQQKVAANAIGKTDSIMKAYNESNNNFAANWAKFQKALGAFFMNNVISQGFMKLIENLVDTRSETQKLSDAFAEQKTATENLEKKFNPLLKRYDELLNKGVLNQAEQTELKEIIAEIASAMPAAVTEWDKYGNAIKISTDRISDHISANRVLMEASNRDAAKALLNDIESYKARIQQTQFAIDALNKQASAAKAKSGIDEVTWLKGSQYQNSIDSRIIYNAKLVESLLKLDQELGVSLNGQQQYDLQVAASAAHMTAEVNAYFGTVVTKTKEVSEATGEANEDFADGLDYVAEKNTESAKKIEEDTFKLNEFLNQQEDIRQQVFLALADEETKAMAELDAFFEELINNADAYGIETVELFKLWESEAAKLGKALNNVSQAAAQAMILGPLGDLAVAGATATAAASEKTQAQIDAEIALRKQLMETMVQTGVTAIENAQTEEEAIKGVVNAIREAIKAKIMEAVANAVAKALGEAPFPLNIVLGIAAGAAASALFDRFVPQAAEGYTGVIGGQDGKKYNARNSGVFSGYYDSPTLLVGEQNKREFVQVYPDWMLRNPFVMDQIGVLEAIRSSRNTSVGGKEERGERGSNNSGAGSFDIDKLVDEVRQLGRIMEKSRIVVMPDQTLRELEKRKALLTKVEIRNKA